MDSLDKFRLRVTEFNVENLFVLLDHYQGQDLSRISEDQWQGFSSSTIANKPIDEVRNIAKIFSELNSDIYMLCEVGGRESLENFNRHFLGDRYRVHLIEGNSDRGIDLGYLVSKALPFKVDLISHKHRSIDFLYPHERQTKETGYSEKPTGSLCSHRFSRDVLELRLFVPDATLPCLVLMMVHLKSQLDRDRIDPLGRDRRKAELEKLVKIFIEITDEFKGTVPVLVGGDFNGNAQAEKHDAEFDGLYHETKLRDALDIAGVPVTDRHTYVHVDQRGGATLGRQLDYIFVPPLLHARVIQKETFIYRYKDVWGFPLPQPKTLGDKKRLPSDHYPVVLTLDGLTGSSGLK